MQVLSGAILPQNFCSLMTRFTRPFGFAFALLCSAAVVAQQSPDSTTVNAMLEQWHGIPEATVEAVGLAAGAGGLDEVPGALHLITPQELQRFAYSDPMRTLRTVSGVNLQEEDGFGLRPNIGMRGSGVERSARITLMEDGVLIAPAPYAAPAAYYFPSIARMSSVEVLKGSSQIAHGPQTAGGAINLVTTAVPDSGAAVMLRTEAGAFGNQLLHARAGATVGQFAVLAEFLDVSSDGFKTLPGGGETGFDKRDVHVKAKWRSRAEAGLAQTLQLKITTTEEESHETYLGLTAADFAVDPLQRYAASQLDRMTTDHSQAVLTHEMRPGAGRLTLRTEVYRTDFHRNWYKLDKVSDSTGAAVSVVDALEHSSEVLGILRGESTTGAAAVWLKANNRTYFAEGVQHRGIWRVPGARNHRLVYGLRLHRDGIDRFQWVDGYSMNDGAMAMSTVGTPGTAGNRVETAEALAGYARGTLRFGDFTFTPGMRHERILFQRADYGSDADRTTPSSERANQVSVWLPGLGVNWAVARDLNVFAGLHRGFIPPGSAPETKAETSANAELGLRYSGQRISAQVVAFHNTYNNLLGADLLAAGGGGTGDLFNGGTARTQGLEVEATWNAWSNAEMAFPVRLAYTFTDARFTSAFASDLGAWGQVMTGDALPYLAPHQLAVVASCERSAFAADVSARYTAAMRTVAGQGDLLPDFSTDAATVLDAGVRWFASDQITFSAGLNNLLNATYIVARRPAGLRPGMPRAFRLGVRFDF